MTPLHDFVFVSREVAISACADPMHPLRLVGARMFVIPDRRRLLRRRWRVRLTRRRRAADLLAGWP